MENTLRLSKKSSLPEKYDNNSQHFPFHEYLKVSMLQFSRSLLIHKRDVPDFHDVKKLKATDSLYLDSESQINVDGSSGCNYNNRILEYLCWKRIEGRMVHIP